jgi:hypothetical protein
MTRKGSNEIEELRNLDELLKLLLNQPPLER